MAQSMTVNTLLRERPPALLRHTCRGRVAPEATTEAPIHAQLLSTVVPIVNVHLCSAIDSPYVTWYHAALLMCN